MKATVDPPNDLVREIKLRAINEDRKLKEVVTELLRCGLEPGAAPTKATALQRGRIAFPLFPSSPNAPASQMSIDAIIALEQSAQLEEDYASRG